MRVLLIHNPEAGGGDHEAEKLLEALAKHGDDVTLAGEDFENADADLLVVAGGDGTVGHVVRRIAGGRQAIMPVGTDRIVCPPLLILPTGTANNIAGSLGIEKPQLDLRTVWTKWTQQAIDVAVADGEIVVEAAGCGVIAAFMRAESDDVREGVKREAKSLAERVESSPLFDYRMTVDGEEIAGEALLIEAMLIRQVGPNIITAPDADPSDGLLDVVTAEADSRGALLRYLRSGGRRHLPSLTTRRGRQVTIACDAPWHFDDRAVDRGTRTIEVRPGAWQAMVPPRT